jgi:hypothetical protein
MNDEVKPGPNLDQDALEHGGMLPSVSELNESNAALTAEVTLLEECLSKAVFALAVCGQTRPGFVAWAKNHDWNPDRGLGLALDELISRNETVRRYIREAETLIPASSQQCPPLK